MKVIIFGVGDFAKQLHYYLDKEAEYEVEYFCVNEEYYTEKEFLGRKVITFEEGLVSLSTEKYKFIIGVGYKNLKMRKEIFEKIKAKGFGLINYISPNAVIYGNIIGEGNVILSNVIIEPFSSIVNNNIIWSNSVICHDSVIGNHNFIAANSIVGGFSEIIEGNFLGFNSTIKDNVIVDKEVIIGAKSLVMKSPENHSAYYGVPAKKIREHSKKGIQIF
ncbi:acetyltransferase [Paenibacillus sp. FSL R10-2796]|uniref:acetyltransferase n=1 Tax=Paenibacillus sp. FSL R10-2796 TaxID=2954663 RepID=UPI0030DA9511